MDEIFLRSVELSNFRVYGDSYTFELPPEPSVTLLVGANGIGKTSFFDGVEWALTSQVSRFSDIPVDRRRREINPLTRIGAPENSHRVSLGFTDGLPVDRGSGFVPDEAAIVSLLKKPNWPAISNLHGYLSITHFLGQAAARRFSVREPKSQWEALKGPAGVDRINSLREKISGQGVRMAFTRALRDKTKQLEDATKAFDDWRSSIAERDRILSLSRSARSADPAEVISEIRKAIDSLKNSFPQRKWETLPEGIKPETALEIVAGHQSAAESIHGDIHATTERLTEILSRYSESGARQAALETLLTQADAELAALAESAAQATAEFHTANEAKSQSDAHSAQLIARTAALSALQTHLDRLASAEDTARKARARISRSRAELEEALSREEELRAKESELSVLRLDRRTLSSDLSRAMILSDLTSSIGRSLQEQARLSALITPTHIDTLRAETADLRVELSAITDSVRSLEDELGSFDKKLATLTKAVASIAQSLDPDDTTCPVCKTHFDLGVLRQLAEQTPTAGNRRAVVVASELAAAKLRKEDLAARLDLRVRSIREFEQLAAALGAEQRQQQKLVQQLVDNGGDPKAHYGEAEITACRNALGLIDDRISAGISEAELAALLSEVQATIQAARAAITSAEGQAARAVSDQDTARVQLALHPDLWSPETGVLVPLSEVRANAEADAKAFASVSTQNTSRLALARAARDSIAAQLAVADSTRSQHSAELARLNVARDRLLSQWADAGFEGVPASEAIDSFKASLVRMKVDLEGLKSTTDALLASYRRWLDDQELRARQSAIRSTMTMLRADSEERASNNLQSAVSQAQIALERTQAARTRMDEIGTAMQERAEKYSDDVLRPLNDTIKRFARTLMTWTDESIVYRAEHSATRSELRPSVIRSSASGDSAQIEMNPNLYFSEGQLSALSVSALLAASTTFSWSRWRGLLLDDPLQHNDVIHASAFMDLLRLMVRELRYQVVLSTHDSAEAELFIRKCSCAGIHFKVHELVPRGEQGLISAVA